MNFDQIKRAIIAKTKDKSNMPEWYYERKAECIGCEFNSGNIEKLSFKDRIRLSHNFGKDACTICTCGIDDKTSDPVEECPLTPPKWNKIDIGKSKPNNILKNLSPTKVRQLENNVFDYGTIKYNSDTTIELQYDSEVLENFSLKASCGCTVPTQEKNKDGYRIKIKYDSKRLGQFTKSISIKDGSKILLTFKIKGNVKK